MKAVLMMAKSESPPKPDSICSEQTGNSALSDGILALGRKLVDELGLEESTDTLGRWMAHHIAALIAEVESATGEVKQSAEKACFEAIMALWKHRAELPDGKRPFQDLEPVVRAIESLDPDDDRPRYFRSARPPKGEDAEKSPAEIWLDTVAGLDYSAKVLIGYCLAEAASATIDKSKKWVKLAEAASADDGIPEIVIRFVSTKADLGREPDVHEGLRRQLQDRLKRLEGFTKLAEALAGQLRERLTALPEPKETSEDSENHLVLSRKPPFG
jgi:hypothetical protein